MRPLGLRHTTRAAHSSQFQPGENIEASISERLVNSIGGLAHEVDHVGLGLWAISLGGLPMVEPTLVGMFEVLWT